MKTLLYLAAALVLVGLTLLYIHQTPADVAPARPKETHATA